MVDPDPVCEVTSSRMGRRTSSATAWTDFGHLTAMVASTLAIPSCASAVTLAASLASRADVHAQTRRVRGRAGDQGDGVTRNLFYDLIGHI